MTVNTGARTRLFFAHQSVGADIVAGIQTLARERPVPEVEALEAPVAASNHRRVLWHAALGRNGDPVSKLSAFAEWLDAGIGGAVDHAMIKFCYVDLADPARADSLARTYGEFMARIRARHPRLRLVHCTIPLRTLPHGPYALLRRAMGHRHAELERNRAREMFNAALRRQAQDEPLFDLARHESTRPDGRACAQPSAAGVVPGLTPDYSSDGGHLNERGRKILAGAFLDMFDTLESH